MSKRFLPTMSSKDLKHLHSLSIKKFRCERREFILEGRKLLNEAIASNRQIEKIFFTHSFLDRNENFVTELQRSGFQSFLIEENIFKKFTAMKTPEGILAIAKMFENNFNSRNVENEKLIIYLDKITDPGNMGAIIRSADWYGINSVMLSKECVELQNPKTIRSTMGSIFHINIYEECDEQSLSQLKGRGFKIIAATLRGKKIEMNLFKEKCALVFSSESHGLSAELRPLIDEEITIPKFGRAESLNVSAAAASILALVKLQR